VPEATSPPLKNPPINEDGHVLKSRRGLLAAGLAVAVIGAIGVVSTVNAGADQIASPPEASSAQAAADNDAPDSPGAGAPDSTEAGPPSVEPPVLPWGARPTKVKKGRAGATSRTLRAEGLSVAPPDMSGSLAPRAKYGPKGRSGRTSVLRSEQTNAVPPKPLGVKAAAENDVNYLYNVGSQTADTAGIYANVTIGKPELDKDDFHTLAELALQSADGKQIVEVGWTVDRLVNGDDDPHLFVFHWINGEPTCYNCGFEQVSPNVKPGSTLTYGVTKKFGIQYYKDAWWIAYDTEWVGYFPEKTWNDQGVKFNRSGFVQVFGEVAAAGPKPCTDMGNGTEPKNETAARVSSVSYIEGPSVDMFIRSTNDLYDVSKISGRSFRYGGPGAC
jgi:hypothetical protein